MPYRQVLLRHLLFACARDESTSSRCPYNTSHEFALIFFIFPTNGYGPRTFRNIKEGAQEVASRKTTEVILKNESYGQ